MALGAELSAPLWDASSQVSRDDSCAYLSLSMLDLIAACGDAEAWRRYEELGRQAFCPTRFLTHVLAQENPGLVVTTCHVRMERAAVLAARQRGCPSLLRLRQLLHDRAIGRVVRASFEAGQWLPDWRSQQDHRQSYSADPQRVGGVVLDLIHEIDAAPWLLGPLTPVACQIAQVPALGIRSEAVATALLRRDAGALVQIGLDYVARRPLRRYQLVGEAGTLCWDLLRRELVLDTPQGSELIDCGPEAFTVAATYPAEMAAFLAAVRGEATPLQPLQDGLDSAALAISLKELAWANL
jgi:predicted dehydrogenase